jgi:hypothetical protein
VQVLRRVVLELKNVDTMQLLDRFHDTQRDQRRQTLSVRGTLISASSAEKSMQVVTHLPQGHALVASLADLVIVLDRLNHVRLAFGQILDGQHPSARLHQVDNGCPIQRVSRAYVTLPNLPCAMRPL